MKIYFLSRATHCSMFNGRLIQVLFNVGLRDDEVPRGGAEEKGLWTFEGFRDDGLLRLPRETTSSFLTPALQSDNNSINSLCKTLRLTHRHVSKPQHHPNKRPAAPTTPTPNRPK